MIIDDSDSVSFERLFMTDLLKLYFSFLKMGGGLWLQARDALAGVAEFSRQKGGESIDIYCLNSPRYRLDIRVGLLSSSSQSPTSIVNRAIWTSAISLTIFPHKVFSVYLLTTLYSRHGRSDASWCQAEADSGFLCPED